MVTSNALVATKKLTIKERQALTDLASIARSMRFDMDRRAQMGSRYLIEAGQRVAEVVQFFDEFSPRDWDGIMKAID